MKGGGGLRDLKIDPVRNKQNNTKPLVESLARP